MSTHSAALFTKAGTSLSITVRPTPTPGPNEVLISVSSIALNPVDYYQRDFGMMVTSYPAVLGSDVAGTVHSVGSSITALVPGQRVLAFASAFYAGHLPDYGGFQKIVLVHASNVCPIPDALSFNEAAMMPMAVATSWAGFWTIGMPLSTQRNAGDKKALLVWGGASSIGAAAVQIAALMGFVVHTTASEKHHAYLKTLGASMVFDYKSPSVVDDIVSSVMKEDLELITCYAAVPNSLDQCVQVLQHTRGQKKASIAHAPLVPEGFEAPEGFEVKFVSPPADVAARNEHHDWVFGTWLKEALLKQSFVASPKMKLCAGGLGGLDAALNVLKEGVSGEKVVLEI